MAISNRSITSVGSHGCIINIQNHLNVMIFSALHHAVSQLVPWKTSASGHQLGKPSDMRWNMSTHKGSFVFFSFNYHMTA